MKQPSVRRSITLAIALALLAPASPLRAEEARLRADARVVEGDLSAALREEVAPATPGRAAYLAARLRGDLRALVRLPRTASPRGWGRLGAGLLAVGGLSAFDEPLRDRVRQNATPGSMRLARDLRPLGREGGLVLLGGAWGLGHATGRPRLERIGEDGLESTILAAGLLAPALKELAARARPRQGEGSRSFHAFGGEDSFPSGEASEAFAIAAVISTHAERRWVKATAWGLATLVSLGRMELDAHWASDVAVGALLGAGAGHWAARRHPAPGERAPSAWAPELAVAPALGRRGGVLYLGWSW